jgi:alkylation response protein AidB-like acyl-CoA dehydrogenase
MDFSLSEDDAQLVELVDRVAMEKFRPTAFENRDEVHRPVENMRLLGELGILGVCLPEEVGGEGRSAISGILAIERIAHACPRTGAAAVMAIAGPGMFIARWGNSSQKDKYLPPILRGEEAWSISLSEPGAGTALTDLTTRASIDGDVCRINGAKTFCSSAGFNDHILLFCRFGPTTGGIGAVILDRDTPGLTISKAHHHMGGTLWHELFLDNATVPLGNVLFEGNAFRKLMSSYSLERTAAGAWAIGVAQAAFEMARDYSMERKQFGRPICEFQLVQGRLADMWLRLEQARWLVYKACVDADGTASRMESSMAKVAATEAAVFVTDQAMQMFGASGMSQEMPLEWMYRMVRPYTVAGGTSDIHRVMIASEILQRRFDHRPARSDGA